MAGNSRDAIVTNIEYKYDVRAIQSEEKGLYYLEDYKNTYIGILVIRDGVPMHIIISKKQASALIKELEDVCKMRFGGLI